MREKYPVDRINWEWAILVFVLIIRIGSVAILKFLQETKNKSIEDIEEELMS